MKKLGLALTSIFFICSLAFISGVNFGKAQTPTSVTGIIFSDQTWTAANSPYNITGPTAVNAGVTLTVEPGVTVDFNMYTLQVNGTFIALGTSGNPITLNGGYHSRYPVFASEPWNGQLDFTSVSNGWNSQTGTGSIIQYANIISLTITANVPLKIDSNSFSGAYADDAIDADSGASIITNNVINGSTLGVGGGAPLVSENTIQGFEAGGGEGISITGGSPRILNNVLFLGYIGMNIDGDAYVTAENNVVANYSAGLFTYEYDALTFQGNLMLYDNTGISLETYGTALTDIENNTIAYSANALDSIPASSTLAFNNLENNQKNLIWDSATNLNAANNWWGTTDASAIGQSIYDYKNNYNLGNVTFTPFLDAPNSEAPAVSSFSLTNRLPIATPNPSQSPSSTSSPAPTSPTASRNQPSQPNPTSTAHTSTGSSVLSQNQLYDVIAILVAVIVGLTIAFVVVLRRKKRETAS